MNELEQVACQVRESFSGLHMATPVEQVFAASRQASRRRARRRLLSGLTAATAVAAGTAAAVTLTLGGAAAAPARSGTPPPSSPGPGTATLAAFSVTSGPGDSTTLILRKGGPQLDPSALRAELAEHGIPALVTVGTFCRSADGASGDLGKVLNASDQPDGSAIVINGRAIPPGDRLSIGLFPDYTRMLLIKDGAPLSCGSTSRQPAVRVLPTGTPIRG